MLLSAHHRSLVERIRWMGNGSWAGRLMALAVVASLALGTCYRISGYLNAADLGNDEAANSYFTEFYPLEGYAGSHTSYAPGYSVLRHSVVLLLGSSAKAHRLLSVLASVSALLLLGFFLSRLFPLSFWWLGFGLFALSPNAVYYAFLAKQYSTDQLFYVLLFGLTALHIKDPKNTNTLKWLVWTGTSSIWFSFASVFLLASIGVVLLIKQKLKREKIRTLMPLLTIWSVSFLFLFGLVIFHKLQNPAHHNPWLDEFVPLKFWTSQNREWVSGHLFSLFESVARFPFPKIALFLFIVGIARLWRRHWEMSLLLILPLGLTFIASMIKCYPFHGRCMSFIVPFLCLSTGFGLAAAGKVLDRKNQIICVVGGVLLVNCSTIAETWMKSRLSALNTGIEKAFHIIGRKLKPNDYVFMRLSATNQFDFYMRSKFSKDTLHAYNLPGDWGRLKIVPPTRTIQSKHKITYLSFATWSERLTAKEGNKLFRFFDTYRVIKSAWILQRRTHKEEIKPFLLKLTQLGEVKRIYYSQKTLLYKFTRNSAPTEEKRVSHWAPSR